MNGNLPFHMWESMLYDVLRTLPHMILVLYSWMNANGYASGERNQLSIFADIEKRDRREHLEDAIEELRGRFGKKALTNAVLLGDLKMPGDGRDKVKMPGMMYV